MTTLFHRTCEHRLPEILEAGELRPSVHATLGYRFIWLTSLASATREQLGLTSHTLECDRMTHLLRIDEGVGMMPWSTVRNHLPIEPVRHLEATKGTLPAIWWVGAAPLRFEVVS